MIVIKKQSGIALVQILLITAIMTVMALYLMSTSKGQVRMAQWAADRTEAMVAAHDAKAKILFALLTEPLRGNNQEAHKRLGISNINFHNTPILLSTGVIVKLQDHRGLLNLAYPNKKYLEPFLAFHLRSEKEASLIIQRLLDWQDIDTIPRTIGSERNRNIGVRNSLLPSLNDIEHISSLSTQAKALLMRNGSIYKRSAFNPMTAPMEILQGLTNIHVAEQIISMRNSNQLTAKQFSEITGIKEGEFITFYPSYIFTLNVESSVGDSKYVISDIVEIEPYAAGIRSPINILNKI
jgi:general secretion pathway protein K